jgi:MFS family permease
VSRRDGTVANSGLTSRRFFFHERVRYTNLWVFCLLGGPFLGPFIAAWLIQAVSWRADYGILAALHGLSTILVIVFGDETLYDRANPQKRETGLVARMKLLVGITGHKAQGRPSPWKVTKDLLIIQIKPQIFFITVIYVMVLVAWVIGVNTTVSQLVLPPPYSFSPSALAASWIAPMIGAVIGGLWGDWFNSWLQARYIRTHAGVYVVENRLWGTYAPTIIGFTGLVLYGQTLQHSMHWIGLLIAWSFIAFAMVAATTAVSAYCLDSFPNHAALVAAIVNMWR